MLRAVPCKNMRKNYGYSDAKFRAELMQHCKNNPQPAVAQPAPSPAPQAAPAASPRSTSCNIESDITGTKDDTPSSAPPPGDCKEAGTLLHSARVTRKQYPEYAQEQYKRAAAAARRAGDINLELIILREATAPQAPEPPTPDPASEQACAAPMREALADLTGAQAIEKNDPSCVGLLQAAENYFSAGRIFFRAIKPGLSNDQIARSCENKKANEMFWRRDALIHKVDRMREAGMCSPKRVADAPPPTNTPPMIPPDECKKVVSELVRQRTSLDGRTDADSINLLSLIDTKAIELAAQGCRSPNELPITTRSCEVAKLTWSMKDNVPAEEIARRLKAAGCPQ